jgi:hypothetical protein
MDAARAIAHHAWTSPRGARFLVLARLDKANPAALSVILKTLEELPPTTSIVLIGTELPPETIVSRTELFVFPLLTDEQVVEVLLQRRFKPTEAQRWAQLARGQVQRALDLANGLDAKIPVLAAVRSIRERDEHALDGLAGRWSDEHTELLANLCREAITGRWRIFSEAEVEGMGRKLPLAILVALRPEIRPRLVVRSSLMTVLKGAT